MRRALWLSLFLCSAPLFAEPEWSDLTQPVSLDASKTDNRWQAAASAEAWPPETTVWRPIAVPGYLQAEPELEARAQALQPPVVWYRLRFRLAAADALKLPLELSLRLGRINDRDRAYLNGEWLGETGVHGSAIPTAYDRVRVYPVPRAFLRPGQTNEILIRVESYGADFLGFDRGGLALGPTAEFAGEARRSAALSFLFLGAYAAVGGYFLFLFARRTREVENLFFGVFCLTLVLYQAMKEQIKYDWGLDFVALKRIEFTALFLLGPLFFYFLRFFFRPQPGRFRTVIDAAGGVGGALCLAFLPYVWFTDNADAWWRAQTLVVERGAWILLMGGMLALALRRALAGDPDARIMFIGVGVLIVSVVVDQMASHGIIALPPTFGYAFSAFVFSAAVVLSNRFVRLHSEVEDLNRNLEDKVEERTRQLEKAFAEVNALKEQQDGDYFLTSLLLQPLSSLELTGQRVRVELLTVQKKQFQFRRWNAEIGGDLSTAHSIRLRGRACTAILCGDAMGKSIQGAGGALVLGTVFKSVINRTLNSALYWDKAPERWLKDCFLELQDIFVSFDGRMLVAAALALVDDATGLCYYINAEQPSVVLWRNGGAAFVDGPGALRRKLGVDGALGADAGRLAIATLQLEPGDVLIFGSDGRDDLLLGLRDDGGRIINEDETLFLEHVRRGAGELEPIYCSLLESGALTDDLALLRVSYLEDAPVDSGDPRTEAAALAAAARAQFRAGDYASATQNLERAVDLNPDDLRALALLSQAAKLSGDLARAALEGERVRLRAPEHAANLLNLADVYRRLGDFSRAIKLLGEAESLGDAAPATTLAKLRALLAR